MEDISNNDKNEKSDQINNSSLGDNSRDHKKQKYDETQNSQSLRKTPQVDILLRKIQPSLSEREWIINQRQRNVSAIMSTKGELVCTNSFDFLI